MADTINKNIEVTVVNKASAALKNISKDFGDVADSAENVNKKSGNLASGISGIITKLGPLALGIGSAAAAYGKMKDLFASSIAEFKEGELAQTKLSTALGFTSSSLIDYANQLQKVTMYSDDELMTAQAQFAMYTQDEEQIKKLTKAATDLAAAKGIDLNTATSLLTRSISTGTNALERYGIEMSKSADVTERIDSISKSATDRFNNMAEALGKTSAGKVTILKNEINNLKEGLGGELVKMTEKWDGLMLELGKITIPFVTKQIIALNTYYELLTGKTWDQIVAQRILDEEMKKGPEAAASGLFDILKSLNEQRDETIAKIKEQHNGWQLATSGMSKEGKELALLNEKIKLVKENLKLLNEENLKNANVSLKKYANEDNADLLKKKKTINDMLADDEIEAKAKGVKELEELDKKYAEKKKNLSSMLAEDEYNTYKAATEELKTLDDKRLEDTISFYDSYYQLEKKNNEETLKGKFENINLQIDEELTRYKFLLDQKIISQEDYNAYSLQLENEKGRQELALNLQFINQMVDFTSTATSMVSSIQSTYFEGVNHEADKKAKKERDHAMATIKNRKQLDAELKRIDGEAEKRAEEQYKAQKKMAMIMSIIQTSQAVTGALTMMPPPVGIAMAIIVGTLGAIQTGIIASQAFAGGGIVQSAGAPSTGDKVNARLNPGEMVLNQTQKDNMLWNLATTRQRQEQPLAVGGDTYVVQGNLDTNAVKEIKKYKEEFLDVLRASNKELAQRGYQYAY